MLLLKFFRTVGQAGLACLLMANGQTAQAAHPELKELFSCLLKNQVESLQESNIENTFLLDLAEAYRSPTIDVGVRGTQDLNHTSEEALGTVYLEYKQNVYDYSSGKRISALLIRRKAEAVELKNQIAGMAERAVELSYDFDQIKNEREILEQRSAQLDKVIGYLGDLTKAKVSDGSDFLFAQAESLKVRSDIGAKNIAILNVEKNLRDLAGRGTVNLLAFAGKPHPSEKDGKYWRTRETAISTILKESLRAKSLHEERKAHELSFFPKTDLSVQVDSYRTGEIPSPYTETTGTLNFSWPLWDGSLRRINDSRIAALARVHEDRARLAKLHFTNGIELAMQTIKTLEAMRETLKQRVEITAKAHNVAWQKLRLNKMSYVLFAQVEQDLFGARAHLRQTDLELGLYRVRLSLLDEFSNPDFFVDHRPACAN